RRPGGAVIGCAGPRAAGGAALAGGQLPLERVPGLLAVSHPVAPRLNHVCHGPDVAFRPDPAGGVVMGHAESLDRTIDATTPPDPPPPACGELLTRTAHYLPAVTAAGLA